MEVDRFDLVHHLLTDGFKLFLELLVLCRIVPEMFSLLRQRFERERHFPHRVQRVERLDSELFVVTFDRLLLLFKILFGLLHWNDFTDIYFPILQLIPERQHELDRHRHSVDHGGDIKFPLFNPFGDLDFTFSTQERHTTHFLEVEPHRIIRSTQGSRRQIDGLVVVVLRIRLHLLAFLSPLTIASFRNPFSLRRFDDLDVHLTEHRHDAAKLIG